MSKFAKLFDLEETQVLAIIEIDSEEDCYTLSIRTNLGFGEINLKIGFEEEEKAHKALDGFKEENAKNFLEDMKKQFDL